jgi:tetratricopeptide (TPR) repeat protein
MGDRAVYCARLESVCALIGTRGSNPRPSATLAWYGHILAFFALFISLATAAAAQVPRINPIESAQRAYQTGKLDEALAILDEAEQRGIRSAKAFDIRGRALMELGRFDQAIQAFQAAQQTDAVTFGRQNIGDALMRQKRWGEARAAYQAAIKTSNVLVVNERLRFATLMTYLASGDEEGAQRALKDLPFPTETSAYYYAQAAWAFAHGDTREGRRWVERAEDIHKPRSRAWFARHLYEFGWLKEKPPLTLE